MKKSWLISVFSVFLVALIAMYSHAEIDQRDFDGDGDVDGTDLQVFAEKFGTVIWYKDFDGDGYSDGTTVYSVSQPEHYYLAEDLIDIYGDFDDTDGTVYPGATEICEDGKDNDQDGYTDYDDSDCTISFPTPNLIATLSDSWHEAWLGSPAVADIDNDFVMEIIVPRYNQVIGWHLDNTIVFRKEILDPPARIWSSPIVANLIGSNQGVEIAVAAGGKIYAWDATGANLPGFPVTWQDEMKSLAAGDIDGDGELELVAVTTNTITGSNGLSDNVIAFNMDGSIVSGFPPNTTDASGCDTSCMVWGGYDQNIALGDVNGDNVADIFVTQDIPYLGLYEGDGRAFDANSIFSSYATKFLGIIFLHDYAFAQQGWAPNPDTANKTMFTSAAPAIADINGDGLHDIVVLGSVRNASQTDTERGVGLWVLHNDGTRLAGWEEPFHAPDYLAGLYYLGGNIVAMTNQVAVADVYRDSGHAGLESVFAGFDGKIHCVDALKNEIWQYTYTTDDRIFTAGVVIADLSATGLPEIIFTTYSPDNDKSHLFILNYQGYEAKKIPLPDRGAMPVPTIADANRNGTMEIIVSLKDAVVGERQVLVYEVPGSDNKYLPWPTGRTNYLRNGFVP